MNTNCSNISPLRVGVVGARRRRQGIGEHVSRFLARHGAEVAALVGTRAETVEQTRDHLRSKYRIEARGYLRIEDMLAAEQLDAVAICSPLEVHAAQLRAALDAEVHVLCEKPLVFDATAPFADEAAELIDGFARAGKWLVVNAQWPYTLAGFQQLHPGVVQHGRVDELQMALSPASTGRRTLPDAMPHVLSMLLTLAPGGGEAEDVTVDLQTEQTEVGFRYVHRFGETAVRAVFRQAVEQPRPAAYAINGRAARRVIEQPGYRMHFEPLADVRGAFDMPADGFAESRRQPLDDPLELLVRDFVHRVTSGLRPTCNQSAKDHSRLLCQIDATARRKDRAAA